MADQDQRVPANRTDGCVGHLAGFGFIVSFVCREDEMEV